MPAGRPRTVTPTDGVADIPADDKFLDVTSAVYDSVLLGDTPDLDEWADRHIVLPRETSSEFGPWRTDRFPPIRKIMKALSVGSKAREVVVMKGAQLFITTIGICWKLYASKVDPGPLLYMQKTKDAAEFYSNQKLKPMIDACAEVADILGKDKPKGYSNAWDNKAYPGGFIVLGGANSTPFLRGSSIGRAIADEEDTYEKGIGGEGSPVHLLKKRMVNFPESVLLRISTPVLKEMSTIELAWEAGTQERYYLPCPHCNPKADPAGNMFWLQWDHIKWSDVIDPILNLPVKVWAECPYCAGGIPEAEHKTWMLEKGDWYTEKTGERIQVFDTPNPSFHLSSLYSPLGFFSWHDAVAEWFEYFRTKDVEKLQVFINQTLAETFHLQGSEVSYSGLAQRRESYAGNANQWDVPDGVLCLTAGADIQDDRIEVEVLGHGLLTENWSIDYVVIPGDTAMTGDRYGMLPDGRPSVWRLLDEYLLKRWGHQSGVELPIEVAMIDASYKTEEVHTFCRLREARRVFPIRGEDGWGKGLWKRATRRHERYRTILYYAHTDEIKTRVYAQLQVDRPGPGFCHFPKKDKYGEKYFKGLTCERRRTKRVSGKQKLVWENPPGARNEPLDCRCYASVAFLAYPVDLEARARTGLRAGPARPVKRRRRGSAGL